MAAIICISVHCLDIFAWLVFRKQCALYFSLHACLFCFLSVLVFYSISFKMCRLVLKITLKSMMELYGLKSFTKEWMPRHFSRPSLIFIQYHFNNSPFPFFFFLLSSSTCCKSDFRRTFHIINSLWWFLICTIASALRRMIFLVPAFYLLPVSPWYLKIFFLNNPLKIKYPGYDLYY